jgi:hypothetical protein
MADNILRLKVDSTEYDNKLKRASDALTRYAEGARKCGGTLEVVEKDTLAYTRALGNMETVSRTAKGKLSEMVKAFTDLSMQYKQLTAEEQNSPFGRALAQSLDTLKNRINNYKSQLNDVGRSIGEVETKNMDFKDVLGIVGDKLGVNGNIMSLVTTGHIGMAAAIGAGVTAVVKMTEAFAEYNEELEKNENITTVTTGLKGPEAGEMTESAEALAKVYGVDFRDVINAANTLMTQFGKTGEDSIQLIREGLQGMIEGDGPKLLSMIQQYAPAFRDAGISASELVAIIHNSEGGIFTDANMNAIVMGIKNIRLMTNATNEALAKIGVDGEAITKKLNDGTMTIFEAMQLVLTKLQETKAGSQAAGEVMQTIFGRQGVSAGQNIAKAINTLNLNLEETKEQTGEIGEKNDELYTATLKLNKAIKECFGVESFASFKKSIKTDVIEVLARVLEMIDQIKDKLKELGARMSEARIPDSGGPKQQVNLPFGLTPKPRRRSSTGTHKGSNRKVHLGRLSDGTVVRDGQTVNGITYRYNNSTGKMVGYRATPKKTTKKSTYKPEPKEDVGTTRHATRTTHTTTPKVNAIKPATEEEELTKKISALTEEYVKATDERRAAIRQEISTAQARLADIKKLKDEAQGKLKIEVPVDYSKLTEANITAYLGNLKKQIEGSDIGSATFDKLTEKLKDATAIKSVVQLALQNGIDTTELDASGIWSKLFSEDGVKDEDLQSFVDSVNRKLEAKGLGTVHINAKGDVEADEAPAPEKSGIEKFSSAFDNIKEGWNDISGIGDGIQSMTQALEGNGNAWEKLSAIINGFLRIGEGITGFVKLVDKMGAATKAAGAASASASKAAAAGKASEAAANAGAATTGAADTMASATAGAAKLPFPASLAAIAAAVAATVGIIATIASLTKGFHHGGVVHAALGAVVPGGNYSGDLVPAMLNSGELVLNQAQQGNLASQLNDAGTLRNLQLTTQLNGEDILLAIDNHGRRTGKGELVTSNIKLW